MKYELVIIWDNGDKNIYEYPTEEKAKRVEIGVRMTLGNQISWSFVRPKLS